MMWGLFEVSINTLQAFLMIYFIRRKLPAGNRSRLWDIGFMLLITAFLSLYSFVDVPFPDTFVFTLPLLFAFFAMGGKWYIKVMWSATLAVIFLAVTDFGMNLSMIISKTTLPMIMSQTSSRVSSVVFCNVLLIAVIFLTVQSERRATHLSSISILLFCIVEILMLAAIETIFIIRLNTDGKDTLFVVANLCLLFGAIGVMILFDMMNHIAEQRIQALTEAESLRLTRKHQVEMKEMYQYLLSRQHDLGKQYQVIEQLLTTGHKADGEVYLAELEKLPHINVFMTGSTAMDALLTLKKLTMDKSSILFTFHPAPLHHMPIKEIDFCTIIANLLDNAIEANMGSIEKKHITLSFVQMWDMFLITCENTTNAPKEPVSRMPGISTKGKRFCHGFGTRNIAEIVEQYHGTYTHECDGCIYIARITLPMKV